MTNAISILIKRFVPIVALAAMIGLPLTATEAEARKVVKFSGYAPGTIVVKTRERRLYYVTGNGRAIRYKVGVGRPRYQWTGRTSINAKHVRPAWIPPPVVRRANPRLPKMIPANSRRNPLGARAMTLSGRYDAIHGTNNPRSIGGFVSHGCIRMYNRDVVDLYRRVRVGTPVIVTR